MTRDYLPLNDLPIELLLKIMANKVEPEKLLRVNKKFFHIFAPMVYECVHCIMNIDFATEKFSTVSFPPYSDDEIEKLKRVQPTDGQYIQLWPIFRHDSVKKVTLLTDLSAIDKFFQQVMIGEDSIMRKFIKEVSCDCLLVEGVELGDHYYNSALLEVMGRLIPRDKIVEKILPRILVNDGIFYDQINRRSSRTFTRIESNLRQMNRQLHIRNSEVLVASSALMLQMVLNFANGSRHQHQNIFNGNDFFSDLSIKSSDVTMPGARPIKEYRKKVAMIKGNSWFLTNSSVSLSTLKYVLDKVVEGMANVPTSCKASFCAISTQYCNIFYPNMVLGYSGHVAKVHGFYTHVNDDDVNDENAQPLKTGDFEQEENPLSRIPDVSVWRVPLVDQRW